MRTVQDFYERYISCPFEQRMNVKAIARLELNEKDYIVFLEKIIEYSYQRIIVLEKELKLKK